MFSNLSLKHKILYGFITVSLVPLFIVSAATFFVSVDALEKEVEKKLHATTIAKKEHLESYFILAQQQLITWARGGTFIKAVQEFTVAVNDLRPADEFSPKLKGRYGYQETNTKDLEISALRRWEQIDGIAIKMQDLYIAQNSNKVGEKQKLLNANDGSKYSALHEKYHPYFKDIQQKFELYDLFLIEPKTGRIVYSVFKELDYGTKLLSGPYKDSGLGEVAKNGIKAKPGQIVTSDFRSYEPSYNDQAAFSSIPIYDNGELVGILAIQFPLDRITALMHSRTGMGETGHFYFVDAEGEMRNNTVLSKDSTIGFKMDNKAVEQVLRRETGIIKTVGYSGNEVIASYVPMDIKGLNWFLIAEQDMSEALASVDFMKMVIVIVVLVTVGSIMFLSIVIGNNLQKPFYDLMTEFGRLAQYELDANLSALGGKEIKELSGRFNGFIERLNSIVKNVKSLSDNVNGSSDGISKRMQQISELSEQQMRAVGEIENAVEGATIVTEEINNSTAQAVQSASYITEKTSLTSNNMRELSDSVKNITEVIAVINDISDQTNLLALNAAIEAARAGDEGRGFAVVAEEVRKLASNTSESTQMIADTVQKLVAKSKEADAAMQEIQDQVAQVEKVFKTVGESVDTQSSMIQQISASMHEFSKAVQSVTNDVDDANKDSERMAGIAKNLKDTVNIFKTH